MRKRNFQDAIAHQRANPDADAHRIGDRTYGGILGPGVDDPEKVVDVGSFSDLLQTLWDGLQADPRVRLAVAELVGTEGRLLAAEDVTPVLRAIDPSIVPGVRTMHVYETDQELRASEWVDLVTWTPDRPTWVRLLRFRAAVREE